MNKLSKYISVFIMIVLIGTSNAFVYASDESATEEKIICEDIENDDFEQIKTENCNSVDIIKCDSISDEQFDIAKEFIDNGTSIYVTGENSDEISQLFNEDLSEFDDSDVYLGTYIQSFGGEYMITPVVADVVDSQECEVSGTELNECLDPCELYTDIQNDIGDLEFFNNLSDSQKIRLQTSTKIGSSFKDVSVFKYFYKEGSAGGTGTNYKYSGSTSISGWSKLGSIRIVGYAVKIKTVGKKTYDDIYSIVTASGLNDKFVKYYTYNMKATSSNTSILDETSLDGGSKSSVTTSIANGVSSDGKNTITSTVSYSYNPKGQTINNQFGEKYIRTWKASPNSKIKNESWKIYPSIMVVNSSGTTSATTVKLYVSSFRVSGGTRNYTINKEASVTLNFKNHK